MIHIGTLVSKRVSVTMFNVRRSTLEGGVGRESPIYEPFPKRYLT